MFPNNINKNLYQGSDNIKLFNKKDVNQFQKTEGINKEAEYRNKPLTKNMNKNINMVIDMFGNSEELKVRDFYLDEKKAIHIAFLYLAGIVDQNFLNDTVISNLIKNYDKFKDSVNLNKIETYLDYLIPITEIKLRKTMGELMISIFSGDTILFIDGFSDFIILGTKNYPKRAVSESATQIAVIGPKDSFIEDDLTNLSLIRRRIKNANLWIDEFTIGVDSNTTVLMVYLKGVADEELVKEVYNRLKSIKIENIIDASYIDGLINEKKFTLLPTLYTTERPDVACANIFEGRVAVIVDGSPFVLIAPTVFSQYFHSVEDYYQKTYVSVFFRALRISAFYLSLLLPAIYVTLVRFHSEILPFQLLVKIAGQREGLPFPSFVEAILMSLVFDILREAGIRAPKTLGPSITTAGALVLGQSAVEAGIISPIMVVIVALTAITTLIIPNYRLQVKMVTIKYIFLLISSIFGLFGLTLTLIFFYLHLCSIKSFGVPYYAPIAPFYRRGIKDNITKAPIRTILNRPNSFTERYKENKVD